MWITEGGGHFYGKNSFFTEKRMHKICIIVLPVCNILVWHASFLGCTTHYTTVCFDKNGSSTPQDQTYNERSYTKVHSIASCKFYWNVFDYRILWLNNKNWLL